jgi:hypothetical protein
LAAAEFAEYLKAVATGHEEIAQNELGTVFDSPIQAEPSVVGFKNGPLPFFQPSQDCAAKHDIIVDDQG